ncbi:MAG: 50S ribosomal protein L20 [Candidatus Saccharimonadales bacterium]
MRVKRGVAARKRHKKVLKQAKGMSHARTSSYRMAKQGIQKSMQYQYRDRRNKKRDFRKLWITRINAAARKNGLTYSQLINKIKASNIKLDRKILAELAVSQPKVFTAIIDQAKEANKK